MEKTSRFFAWKAETTSEDKTRQTYTAVHGLFLFFTDEILNHITFQTNLYNNEISHARGTKPVSPVTSNEIKKLFQIILFMGIGIQ